MYDEDSSSYFRQVVRDCVSDLKKYGYSYCFNDEQVDNIKRILPNVEVFNMGDMFKLTYKESKRRKKAGDVEWQKV